MKDTIMTRKEAIEIIKSATVYTPEETEALETLIPELKESEGERIRKTLINALKTPKSVGELKFVLPEPTREECITYLEKQKERGPLTKEEEYILHRIIEYLEDETCPSEWISLLQDIYCLPYEKQKEQKPWKVGANAYFTPEQKPAEWSEEDEKIRKALIWHLKADVDFVSNGVTKTECLAYLDKQKAQKQEWSGEDERILKGIIGLVGHNQHYNVSNKEMLAWLKSLRPSWKPSEEQMNALLNAEGYLRAGDQFDSAKSIAKLYEQLKKL